MNDIYSVVFPFILFVLAPVVIVNLLFSLLKWAINAPYDCDVHITTKKWYYE